MNKWLELLLGLVLLIVPIYVAFGSASWGVAALSFIKGALVIGIALIGLMLIILGISDISN